jgi:uncharacterized protein (DUF1499 family)
MSDGSVSNKTVWSAKAGFGLALLCILLLAAIVIATRSGDLGIRDAFGYISWIVYGGGAVALIALIGLFQTIRQNQYMGMVMAGTALVAAVTIVWVPYSSRAELRASPRLSDVTTDMKNPPKFVKIETIRKAKKARNTVKYTVAKAALQQKHYSDIKPVFLKLPPDQAFKRVTEAVGKLRWKVVEADAAQGRLEAFESSLIFGFVDDVVVRVRAAEAGSVVDIRSSSRVGRRDAKVNANRVRSLIRVLASP